MTPIRSNSQTKQDRTQMTEMFLLCLLSHDLAWLFLRKSNCLWLDFCFIHSCCPHLLATLILPQNFVLLWGWRTPINKVVGCENVLYWCPESWLVMILYIFHDQWQERAFLVLVYLLKLWIRSIKETRPQETFNPSAPFVTKVAMVLGRDRSPGKQETVLYCEGLQF